MGRVNAETRNGLRVSTTGGLGDFARAAVYTPGARSVIALTAADSGSAPSRIVPRLDGGSVTLTADLADVIVTEYGAAVVRGKSARERAEALIAVADPRQRGHLASVLRERY
jgi:acyl-CoA hydrolase